MLPVLVVLLIGTFAYLFWRRVTTTLTRECRWRQEGKGHWHCVSCNGRSESASEPRHCTRITKSD